MRFLIIETAFIGDVIISLSLARALKERYADSFVAYLVRPESVAIVQACPDVDHVIPFDKYGEEGGSSGIASKASELNELVFDTVFALHSSQRTQRLVAQLNCQTKIGFVGKSLTHLVPDRDWRNRYERAVLPLRALDTQTELSVVSRLVCGHHEATDRFAAGFEHVVAVAPGSVWATKQWGAEKFTELAGLLCNHDIGIVVIGDKAASACGQTIREIAPNGMVLDLTGRASLVESGAAIGACSLVISNDSAPAHLAVAVGTPAIVVFGPTVPEFGFAPPLELGETVEVRDLWCRPCASHGSDTCPLYSHECMTQISAESVFERVMAWLGAIPKPVALSIPS